MLPCVKDDLPLADSLLEQYYEVSTRSRVSLFLWYQLHEQLSQLCEADEPYFSASAVPTAPLAPPAVYRLSLLSSQRGFVSSMFLMAIQPSSTCTLATHATSDVLPSTTTCRTTGVPCRDLPGHDHFVLFL